MVRGLVVLCIQKQRQDANCPYFGEELFSLLWLFFQIEVHFINNVVSASGVQKIDWVLYICICVCIYISIYPPFQIIFHYRLLQEVRKYLK